MYHQIKESEKSNIKWLLNSFNPVPLEFYRYLNRKTKHIATNSYTHALSRTLKISDFIGEERMEILRNIQQQWKVRI